jgi:tRNA (guanine-N7-)-methyltransferase
VDFKALFGSDQPLVVEIGFGMGIATAKIAEEHPGINYVGIEVHRPGIGKLLWEIERRGLANLRVIEGDAAEILPELTEDNTLSGFHVFFPDPWPKKRHHKRRLITRPFTELLGRKLLPGGYIYMVTDWAPYGDWALRELSSTPGLINPYGDPSAGEKGAEGSAGFAPPLDWRPKTKFEEKGLAKNHEIRELFFRKGS